MDLTHLISLLHNKTTFYREVDIDKNKEIYENILSRLEYLNNYYTDLITLIEKEVYMSPSSYLIARNINIIFESIYYSKDRIEDWYKKIENNKNERVVNIHNNINLDHVLYDLGLMSKIPNDKEKGAMYREVFPTHTGELDTEQINKLHKKFKSSKKTNMDVFTGKCLELVNK